MAILRQLYVRGLQIAMNDAALMRVLERRSDLQGDWQRLFKGQRPWPDPLGQHGPFHQLQGKRARPMGFFEAIKHRNVGMVQRSKDLGFALEALHTLFVSGKRFRQHFQRYITAKSLIPRAIHFAHPAGTEQRENVVGTQLHTWSKKHGCSGL